MYSLTVQARNPQSRLSAVLVPSGDSEGELFQASPLASGGCWQCHSILCLYCLVTVSMSVSKFPSFLLFTLSFEICDM